MGLIKLLEIKKGDIISIVGSGGKTSLMFQIAKEIKSFRVLVTTSTKIFVPESSQYDFLALDLEGRYSFKNSKIPGIFVLGTGKNSENKILGINDEILEEQYKYFDYVLVESDGSKRKPVKGWNKQEPVILKNTSITLGVVSIKAIGLTINEENIHRLDKFIDLTRGKPMEKITVEHMGKVILHKDGLFKESKGERILFINQCENDFDKLQVKALIDYINKKDPDYINKIIFGSINNKDYNICFDDKIASKLNS